MKKYKKTRINTFFVEIIIVILFFSIATTIILQVFTTTNYDIQVNNIKNNAVTNSGSISTLYKENRDVALTIRTLFGENTKIRTNNNGKFVVNLNENLSYDNDDNTVVLVIIEESEPLGAGIMRKLDISYLHYNTEVFSVVTATYDRGR